MHRKLSPSGMLILVAAAFMVLASFLPFWETDLPAGVDLGPFAAELADKTAWTRDASMFPVTILPVVCAAGMAGLVLLTTFTGISSRPRLLGITWNQVHLVLGLQAAVMMLAFLLQERGVFQLGTGFYVMLLAGIGLAIGALMREREETSTY